MREYLLHLVHRTPESLAQAGTRWTLATLRQALPWLCVKTEPGLWGVLARLGIVWKRGRSSIASPDPDYLSKLADVEAIRALARDHPGRYVVVYLDEVTIERQPSVAPAYEASGPEQPRARRSTASNTLTRVVATLDERDARVVFQRGSQITVAALVKFYQSVRAAYPEAERIFVVQDNWPVHTHPDVLVALEPQQTRWPWHRPTNWPTAPSRAAIKRWGHLHLPIQIVPLPTYASWCNPIEKLWRKLKQDLLHLHPWADDLLLLRDKIDTFLRQFAQGSLDLLRYVGRSPD